MPDFIQTAGGTSAQTLTGSESGLITRTGVLWVNGTVSVTATAGANCLTNDGYLYAFGGVFSAIVANGSSFDLLNGSQGLITAANPGSGVIDLNLTGRADLVNHGIIHSPNEEAISFSSADGGADFSLNNSGKITSNGIEAIDASVGSGRFHLVNSGLIASQADTIAFTADLSASYTIHVVMNSGSITASVGTAIRFSADGQSRVVIGNSGTLRAWDRGISSLGEADVAVVNSGLIESLGSGQAIALQGGNDVILNSGAIAGDVLFQGGADHLRNSGVGVVLGLVDGGEGADSLIGGTGDDSFAGSEGNDLLVGHAGDDTLLGGTGADRIIGGDGDDNLEGGPGNDSLNGGAGADEVSGGEGDDIVVGRDGSDQLRGGGGNDTMEGGGGDDQLDGGDGNDVLRGRAGEDEFRPGLGLDAMTGGEGADTFFFASAAIAGIGANRDVIIDFEPGKDLINVAGMTPGAFDFIGTSAFSGTAAEIRVIETATGSSIVEFDADGDGTVDAQIRCADVLGLTADDFAL